jgi:hypothetical protein
MNIIQSLAPTAATLGGEVKESKQEQEDLGRENTNEYIRKNERINYIDD